MSQDSRQSTGSSPEARGASELAGTSSGSEWLSRYSGSLMGVFGTPQRVLVRGQGCYVWDADGKQYLDLLGGIAVNALGHAHPFVTSVISSQLATLGHVSNFFTSPTQVALAEKLLEVTGAPAGSKVFFANSGTEANEAAFKLARRNAGTAEEPRTKVVALEGAFHGRTMGALALTAKKAYREPFEPLPGGVVHVPFGDVEALAAAVDRTTQAVFLEPIQGEAGVVPLPPGYLAAARKITRDAGALLIVDEVQTGMGRTGTWLAIEGSGIVPDAVTLAKGLGGGFPIGALVTFGGENSARLTAGQHGTTFGGNPVATAAALATLHAIETQGVLANVRAVGERLHAALGALPEVAEVRGRGLLLGLDLVTPAGVPEGANLAAAVVDAALEAGFIVNAPGPRTVRLAPPLILTAEQADTFVAALPRLVATAAERLTAEKETK
ncbi:Acetylornithine aminotransferase [Sinomonas atrocyanea]|uniref:Acetylornithine aminotransferase n=1 Tax=Sinomonas atrocyanea TaxID=37927 RepID=A0A127A0I7_9MICC|nr:acetylornithine transaminase [Sinomonas atrocyanea]AMM32401.1 Acetylornithine aminotransferase [Sinomonas atrocyanea]GEB63928.1 acetylornithine aminotransferase [Sinomonas atrocyanea]GGG77387.1 acetylornithine aminotransferase [Sinomonas atrocyanea]